MRKRRDEFVEAIKGIEAMEDSQSYSLEYEAIVISFEKLVASAILLAMHSTKKAPLIAGLDQTTILDFSLRSLNNLPNVDFPSGFYDELDRFESWNRSIIN